MDYSYHAWNLAHHLSESRSTTRLRKMLLHLPYLDWKLSQTYAEELASDFELLEAPLYRDIGSVIKATSHIVDEEQKQLFTQIFFKLEDQEPNRAFRAKLEERLSFFRPVFESGGVTNPALLRTLATDARLFAYAENTELLAVSDMRDVVVWDLGKAHIIDEPDFDLERIFHIAISIDGEVVAAIDLEGNLDIFYRGSRETVRFRKDGAQFTGVYVSDDGEYVALEGFSSGLPILVVWQPKLNKEPVIYSDLFFPCVVRHGLLYATTKKGDLIIRDLTGNDEDRILAFHGRPISFISVCPNGLRAITVAPEEAVMIWDLKTLEKVAEFSDDNTEAFVLSVQSSWRKAVMVLGGRDAAILDLDMLKITTSWSMREWPGMLFLANNDELLYSIHSHNGEVRYLSQKELVPEVVSNIGMGLATFGQDNLVAVLLNRGAILLVDHNHGEVLREIDLGNCSPECSVFDPHGPGFYIGDEVSGLISHFDLESGRIDAQIDCGYRHCVNQVLIDTRRCILYSSSFDEVVARDLLKKCDIYRYPLPFGTYNRMAITADSRFLAVSRYGWDGIYSDVRILEAQTGRDVSIFRVDISISKMSFSPDGDILIIGAENGIIQCVAWRTGDLVMEHTSHRLAVNEILFLPDRKRYLSFSEDNRIYLWQLNREMPLDSFWYDEPVFAATFLPGSNQIFMATRGRGFGWFTYCDEVPAPDVSDGPKSA